MSERKTKVRETTKSALKSIFFSKKQLLQSKRYAHRVDVLHVLLKDGRTYCFAEVDEILTRFMKGKVK